MCHSTEPRQHPAQISLPRYPVQAGQRHGDRILEESRTEPRVYYLPAAKWLTRFHTYTWFDIWSRWAGWMWENRCSTKSIVQTVVERMAPGNMKARTWLATSPIMLPSWATPFLFWPRIPRVQQPIQYIHQKHLNLELSSRRCKSTI